MKSKSLTSTLAVANFSFAKKRSKKETTKSKLTLFKTGFAQETMAVRIFHFSLCQSAASPALPFVGVLGWMIESRELPDMWHAGKVKRDSIA